MTWLWNLALFSSHQQCLGNPNDDNPENYESWIIIGQLPAKVYQGISSMLLVLFQKLGGGLTVEDMEFKGELRKINT